MPNWDHRCPECYLDFRPLKSNKHRLRCPWCGHTDEAENFYDPTYYPPYEDEDEEIEV